MGEHRSGCEADGANEPKLPLGVLFVHGMGSAKQGATLREHGEPLVDWLAGGTEVFGRAELLDVAMTPGDGEPARLTCELYLRSAGAERADQQPQTRWLLAESHWADTFKPATYLRIAVWLICAVPWMLGEYAFNALQRERTRKTYWARRLLIPFYAAAGTVLAGPIVFVLALLVPAQYAPVKMIRDWGGKLPRTLAATLGDVYIILATHIDREAIRARIVRDHEWLRARCDRTVVVAHSAGSALTHQLIRDGRMTGVDAYATLGEAIWRMQWMRQLTAMALGKRLGALALALLGFALWVGAILVGWRYGVGWMLLGWLASALVHWWSARVVWGERDAAKTRASAIDVFLVGGQPRVRRWHDYVGSSDPVPGGVLTTDTAGERSFYQPSWIRNTRSIVLDHVTYPHNVEEYVAGIGADIAATDEQLDDLLAQTPLITPQTATRGRIARALRTLALAMTRLASATLVVALIVALWWTDQAGLQRLSERFPWAAEALRDAIGMLPGDPKLGEGLAGTLAGAGIAMLLVAIAWVLTFAGWKAWDGKDRKRFMRREDPVDVKSSQPICSLTLRQTRPRRVDLLFAGSWLLWSAGAVTTALLLAERMQRVWLPAAALAGGALLVAGVVWIARERDNTYGTPAAG